MKLLISRFNKGRSIAQAVRGWFLSAEARVQFRMTTVDKVSQVASYVQIYFSFHLLITPIPTLLHTHWDRKK
jgi:hypothetical protein